MLGALVKCSRRLEEDLAGRPFLTERALDEMRYRKMRSTTRWDRTSAAMKPKSKLVSLRLDLFAAFDSFSPFHPQSE
jgi:hypothetical protein